MFRRLLLRRVSCYYETYHPALCGLPASGRHEAMTTGQGGGRYSSVVTSENLRAPGLRLDQGDGAVQPLHHTHQGLPVRDRPIEACAGRAPRHQYSRASTSIVVTEPQWSRSRTTRKNRRCGNGGIALATDGRNHAPAPGRSAVRHVGARVLNRPLLTERSGITMEARAYV